MACFFGRMNVKTKAEELMKNIKSLRYYKDNLEGK